MTNLRNAELTKPIIGAAIEVLQTLGPGFVESIYHKWREKPEEIDPEWRMWFERLSNISEEETPAQAPPRETPAAATPRPARRRRPGRHRPAEPRRRRWPPDRCRSRAPGGTWGGWSPRARPGRACRV